MLARSFTHSVVRRGQSVKRCQQQLHSKFKVDFEPHDELIEKFQRILISDGHYPEAQPEQANYSGIYFKNLRNNQPIPFAKSKDWRHLGADGAIKESVLQQRKAFLRKQGFLSNEINYLGRTVYANKHLYDLDQKDGLGRSNLTRMQLGLCPVDKSGEDMIIIHHFDQMMTGPWVILPNLFHQKYDKKLHSNVTLHHGVIRPIFEKERKAYWQYQALSAPAAYNKRQGSIRKGE